MGKYDIMNDSPDPVSEPVSEAAAARAKFEQEKMSRRAALRKIGLTSGMALFGMFAVDDLARLALRGLQQHKETQAVAETVAQELRSSGVAFAADGDGSDYYDGGPCTPEEASLPSCAGGRKLRHKDKVACASCVSVEKNCSDLATQTKAQCYADAKGDQGHLTFCDTIYTGQLSGCLSYASSCVAENGCGAGKNGNGASGCANCVTAKFSCYDQAVLDKTHCYGIAGTDSIAQSLCDDAYLYQRSSCLNSASDCCSNNGCNC